MAVTTRDATAIRPFTSEFPESDLEELRRRVAATRFPDKETVDDQSQGTQLATVRALARYWATEHDWRRCEAQLNASPNFITEIDGLDIHFIRVRSKHEDALPLIVTHGWPGSVVEQMKIVDLRTDPTAHGASESDAFHQPPRSWAERAYPNLVHFNEVEKGGHFAAWEQPETYASEIRAGFRTLH